MYLVYTILYSLALLISLPYWLLAMLRSGKYRAGLKERLGFVPKRLVLPGDGEQSIWFHAVSVGEVLAISGLIEVLKREAPDHCIFLSTTTLTGQTLARQRFGEQNVLYMPLDLPFAVKSVLRSIRPAMLVLAETEFWPNFLRLAKIEGASIAVVNGRISDRSLPGYRRFRKFLSPVLGLIDLFLVQTDVDYQRLAAIGAPPERIRVTGNLKFDAKAPPESALTRDLRQNLSPDQRVLVFGSTVDGEEELLVPTFKEIFREFSSAVIVLAPRHPERFDAVAEVLRNAGMNFWRRSGWNSTLLSGGVLLLDSIGELASIYSLAQVAFVGGSLVPRGGHNILEPAQYAKPILIGPHYENFREIVNTFLARDAVRIVTAERLTETVLSLLRSPQEALAMGERSLSVIHSGRGSTQRTLEALRELLDGKWTARELSAPRA